MIRKTILAISLVALSLSAMAGTPEMMQKIKDGNKFEAGAFLIKRGYAPLRDNTQPESMWCEKTNNGVDAVKDGSEYDSTRNRILSMCVSEMRWTKVDLK